MAARPRRRLPPLPRLLFPRRRHPRHGCFLRRVHRHGRGIGGLRLDRHGGRPRRGHVRGGLGHDDHGRRRVRDGGRIGQPIDRRRRRGAGSGSRAGGPAPRRRPRPARHSCRCACAPCAGTAARRARCWRRPARRRWRRGWRPPLRPSPFGRRIGGAVRGPGIDPGAAVLDVHAALRQGQDAEPAGGIDQQDRLVVTSTVQPSRFSGQA